MNWKEKLLIATSAFIPMSGAVAREAHAPNALRRRAVRRVRRRTSSVPVFLDPQVDTSLKIGVRLPAVQRDNPNTSYCKVEIEASLFKVETGDMFLKAVRELKPGAGGTTIEFDLREISEPTAVSADVKVVATGRECDTGQPLTSVVVDGLEGRTYIPSVFLKWMPIINKAGGLLPGPE